MGTLPKRKAISFALSWNIKLVKNFLEIHYFIIYQIWEETNKLTERKIIVILGNAGRSVMVARVLWEDLIWVQIPAPRLRVSYNGITRSFQDRDRGSTPLTRSKIKTATFAVF